MRVYWPTTLSELARVAESGLLAPAPAVVHAVTRTLRDFYADADPRDLEEELEYVAMSDAAEQSVRLLCEDPSAAPRRIVVALDVADGDVEARPDAGWSAPERSRVTVSVPLALDALASIHVDDADAESDVRAAVAALAAADAGDEDAQFAVEACEAHDLLWYDAGELPVLLAVGP